MSVLQVLLRDEQFRIEDSADRYGCTPLWIAASMGHTEAVELLWSHVPNDLNRQYGQQGPPITASIAASGQRHFDTLKFLLSCPGIDIDATDGKMGQSALLHAVAWESYETQEVPLLNLLRAAGANTNLQDHNGNNVLTLAIAYGNIGVARILLTWDELDTSAVLVGSCSALSMTVNSRDRELVNLLLAHSAKTNLELCDSKGRTVLATAVAENESSIAHDLLKAGASANFIDAEG